MTFIGEIRMFAGNFPPAGWAFCDGAPQAISENDALFILIGTTYGGDGQETFNLPNLQSRVPMHQGATHLIGEMGGFESVTLSTTQIPAHSHAFLASTAASNNTQPGGNVPGTPASKRIYTTPGAVTNLHASSVGATGGSQPHENMQPFLGINFIISLYGEFPHQ